MFLLAGCSGVPLTTTTQSSAIPGAAIRGMVHGGQGPIQGAHVYLLAVNSSPTSTYGGPGIPQSPTNQSASVLTSGAGSDSLGYYVTTGADGSFTITGDYTCPSSYAHPYLYASGGYPGSGTSNSAITLVGAVSSCDTSQFVIINEVSTVVLAYSFAGFATDPTHASASNTTLAATDLDNATSTIANLMDPLTSTALATTPTGNGTVPQAEINTLANILAACVNSTGPTSTPCTTLFNDAPNFSGTVPTDTGTAILNIAHNPGANISGATGLFSLQTGSTSFQPDLPSAPNDFTLPVVYSGGGLQGPWGVAIDASGSVWVGDWTSETPSITELSPVGAAVSPSSGFTGGGLEAAEGMAVDSSGNVWAADSKGDGVSEFNSSGMAKSPASTGWTGGSERSADQLAIDASGDVWASNGPRNTITELTSAGAGATGSPFSTGGLDQVTGIAADASGNIWVTNTDGESLSEFNSSGTASAASPIAGPFGMYSSPVALAIDGSGNIWVADFGGSLLLKYCPSCNSGAGSWPSGSGYSGGGLSNPNDVAVDGAGNVWVANDNNNSISEFNSSGTAISGSSGFTGGTGSSSLSGPEGIALDGSGNVWVTNGGGNTVTEFVGAGTPVVTPIVANLLSPYGSHAVNLP